MRVVDLEKVMAMYDERAALAAVERAFVAFSAGRAQIGDAGHFTFDAPGDCHVKAGHLYGDDIFVVKIASGFYDNARLGLPSNQGLVVVLSATTGEALAVLDDRGHLTSLRTAMAGMLAARAIGYAGRGVLGVIGTGTQARLQADFIARYLGFERLLVWGRDPARAQALAADLAGEASGLQALVERADLIVTTTPSIEPLVSDAWVKPGTRIVAVGADGGGKRELDPAILARAIVVVDSAQHCLDVGEAGWAARAGKIAPDSLIELGTLLGAPRAFGSDDLVVADLTGLAVQDAAIAGTIWRALNDSASG
jgi:ornithine cyclodeaminase